MADSTKPMFGLGNLNSLLKSVSADYERRMIEKLARRGFDDFNMSYYTILDSLNNARDSLTLSDMAKKRGISNQSVGKAMRMMVTAGYLSIEKSDLDTRRNDIRLTKFGTSAVQALIEINSEHRSALIIR